MSEHTSSPNFTPYLSRSTARLAAVQAMYQHEQTKVPIESIVREFTLERPQTMVANQEEENNISFDHPLLMRLVRSASARQEDIDQMIAPCLAENWTINRLDLVIRAILRVGCTELLEEAETDAAVIINEYVDITHAFYPVKESKFVNSVLDRIAKTLRKAS